MKNLIAGVAVEKTYFRLYDETKVHVANIAFKGTTKAQHYGNLKFVEGKLIHCPCHQGNKGEGILTDSGHVGKASISTYCKIAGKKAHVAKGARASHL